METLLSYRLQHFLPFSEDVYLRLFTLHNEAVWPAQIVAALAVLVGAWRLRAGDGRAVTVLLAVAWAFVGWAYFGQRYATLLWAAPWIGVGFGVQALLLAAAAMGSWLEPPTEHDLFTWLGYGVAAAGILVLPLVGPLAGRAWTGAELFGIAPDPTVVVTAGLLLAMDGRRWPFLVVPLFWCVVGGLTSLALGSWPGLIAPSLVAIVLASAATRAVRR